MIDVRTLMLVGEVEESGTASPFDALDWTVERVPDCLQFLSQVLRHRPRIVICERQLPDGNWREVLGIVETLHHPPVVIVTARDCDSDLRQEVLARGGADVLAKPFGPEQLNRVIEQACRRSSAAGTL